LLALADRSRRPTRCPHQVPEEITAMIVAIRQRYPRWGPKKLRAYLQRMYPGMPWPACSTIGELLRRAGLTSPRRLRRRTPPYTEPFVSCRGSNDLWCVDFKGYFRTGDGSRCDPFTLTDSFSRQLLRVQSVAKTDGKTIAALFKAAFLEYGLPSAIRSDNGVPFASSAAGGLSRLSVWWVKLGIRPERIEPGHPEQNGRHERMHRTLKAETASPPAGTLGQQQSRFDAFRQEFNEVRPHEALGQRTPASVYVRSGREYLGTPEVAYDDDCEVRRVRRSGEIKWRGGHVYVSQVLTGEPVALRPVADRRWEVRFCDCVLGILDERRGRVVPAKPVEPKAATSLAAPSATLQDPPGT
jgi:putative transposase